MKYDIIAYESQGSTNTHELQNIEGLEEARAAARRLIVQAYHTGGLAEIYNDEMVVVDTVFREEVAL